MVSQGGASVGCAGHLPLSSFRSIAKFVETPTGIALLVVIVAALRLATSAYATNLPPTSKRSHMRVFFGVLLGVVIYQLAVIPVALLLGRLLR